VIGDAKQPPRLRELLDERTDLALGLKAARARQPDDADAAAIERRLFAALGAGGLLEAANGLRRATPTPPGTATGAGTGLSATGGSVTVALKVALALAIGAGGVAAGVRLLRQPRAVTGPASGAGSAASAPLSVPAPPIPVAPVGQDAPRAPLPESNAGAPAASRVAVRRRAVRSPAAGVPAPAPRPERLRRELVLIEPARAALATDPERALALCAQHQREFPEGAVMTEEREVIAISALAKQRRLDEGRARMAAFDQRYPASPYRGLLQQRLKAAQ